MKTLFLLFSFSVILFAVPKGVIPEETIDIVFVGDIMLDRIPGKYVAISKNPFEFVAPILNKADLRIGNLETVVAATGNSVKKHYTFLSDPKVLDTFKGHLDAVSLANNHTGDFGHTGLLETFAQLNKRGISYFGAGSNFNEAHQPLVVVKKGIRIALLGYNEFRPRSFEAGPTTPGVAWSDDEFVIKDIKAIRDKVDLVLMYMHWGEEYVAHPNERQKSLARKMIDAGADAVIGNHSHITEGAETYKGKLIVYSLGNFIFDDYADSYRESRLELREISRTSWMLNLKMNRSGLVEWDTQVTRTGDDGFPRLVKGAESPSSYNPFPAELLSPLAKAPLLSTVVVPERACTVSTDSQRCVNGKLEYVNVEMIKLQTSSLSLDSKPINDMTVYQLDRQFFMDAELKVETQVVSRFIEGSCELTQLDFNSRFDFPDPNDFEFGLKSVAISEEKSDLLFTIQNSFRDAPRIPFDDSKYLSWLSKSEKVEVKGTSEPSENSFKSEVKGIASYKVVPDSFITPGKDFYLRITGLSDNEKVRFNFAGFNTMNNLGYYVSCTYIEEKNRRKSKFKIPASLTKLLPLKEIPQVEVDIGVEVFHKVINDKFANQKHMVVLERNHRVPITVPIKVNAISLN